MSTPPVIAIDNATQDPLSEALHFLRMDGAFYCRSELRGEWGVHIPHMTDHLWFHVVTEGYCWLEIENGKEACLLKPGTFALVPHGTGHRIYGSKGANTPNVLDLPREQISERYEILRHGQGELHSHMICGALCCDHPAARNLVNALPKLLVFDESRFGDMAWMHTLLQIMAFEIRAPQAGGEAIITRLGDVLVVQAIRNWLATDPAANSGWIGALKDKQIGKAIALIHKDPVRNWSVEGLAKEVAMSRSAFSARFSKLIGEPVMQYITQWRMYNAMDVLKHQNTTVAEVADQFGYQSEAAFSRAFKRVTGAGPGDVKRF